MLSPRIAPTRDDLGIFALSLAIMLVELLLTRIFSVTLYYHFSFLVVSLAMLGLGASGAVADLLPAPVDEDAARARLGRFATWFGAMTAVAVGAAMVTPIALGASATNLLRLLVLYVACAIPFAAGGLVIALLLSSNSGRANRLYFFDLFGAAVACVLFAPITNLLGAPSAVLAAAALGAASGVALGAGRARTIAAATAALLLATAIANVPLGFYDVRVAKGRAPVPTLVTQWNSFSRVEVVGTPESLTTLRRPVAAGLSPTLPADVKVRELILRYDADAATQITGLDGPPSALVHLGYDVTSAAYQVKPPTKVLVLGAGGGRDVLTALAHGATDVTGLEINPITVRLMRGQFRTFTGGLYDNYPGVTIINDEGRSYVRGTAQRFDLIQASLVDTWATSSAGAYALTENSLYTRDAFVEYLDHLAPDGMVSFSRWYTDPPAESLRVVSLAIEALAHLGVTAPAAHVAVVRTADIESGAGAKLATLLVKRAPFTPEEEARLARWAADKGFVVVFTPSTPGDSDFHRLLGPDREAFLATYPYNIEAVDDDRPFFFDRVPLTRWVARQLGLPGARPVGQLTLGGQTLVATLVITSLATLILFLAPLARPDAGIRAIGRGRWAAWVGYFACLGLGFIVIEIILIQRMNLLIGYPVYSLAVVLCAVLASSSVGSLVAQRWPAPGALPRILAAVCGVLALAIVALPAWHDALLGLGTVARVAGAAVAVAPLGFVMGMPFPTGLRLAGAESPRLVTWAWAMNGAASVFGSAFAVLVAMTFGFSWAFGLGLAVYGVALALAAVVTRAR